LLGLLPLTAMKRIIYQNESGGVSVIVPTGELSIEEVAAKDVPEGVAYEYPNSQGGINHSINTQNT